MTDRHFDSKADRGGLDRWLTDEEGRSRVSLDPVTVDPDELVDRLLTEEERVQALARLSLLNNGRTDGIEIRDALTIMHDGDAMLDKVEPLAETWGEMKPGDWTPAHSMVVYVLALLDRPVNTDAVERFLARTFIDTTRGGFMLEDEESAPERTVSFYRAGSLIRGAEFLGDRDYAVEGHEVVACNECCALVLDDAEMANREQHARVAHGLGATR